MKSYSYFISFLLVLLLIQFQAGAQTCDFDERQAAWKASDQRGYTQAKNRHRLRINEFRKEQEVKSKKVNGTGMGLLQAGCTDAEFLIPVVVHVVYSTSYPGSDIADSMVQDQIDILNRAYSGYYGGSDSRIRFCLARKDPYGSNITGINHIQDNAQVYDKTSDNQRNYLKAVSYYDPQKYLNIWVVPDIKIGSSPSTVGGYSNIGWQVSGTQGIVVRYTLFGDKAKYAFCLTGSRGFVLAHEVGHYLGLYHTYEGGCSSGNSAGTCSSQGDLCCDTRPVNQNFNCPVPPASDCPSTYYDGQSIFNNHQNFMDYTEEACKTNFTAGQGEIMRAMLVKYYSKLISPQNINTMNMACCVTVSWFTADNTFLCNADSVKLTAAQMMGGTYLWRIYRSGNLVHQNSSGSYQHKWLCNTPGLYTVELNVLSGIDTLRLTRTNYIEMVNCGNTIANSQGNWYFGKHAGMRFATNGVFRDLSAFNANPRTIYSGEGAVTESDNSGNLLFYAGGDSVLGNPPIGHLYNNLHREVNTIYPLNGHNSAGQGYLSVPRQNRPGQYYLFTVYTDATVYRPYYGTYYSVIDVSAANLADTPSGVNQFVPVPPGSSATGWGTFDGAEQMTAIPRCDGSYWVLMVDRSMDYKVIVFKADSSGITYHSTSSDGILYDHYFGQMKASPDGQLVAAPGILYSFDRSLGVLKKLQDIYTPDNWYYGMSFSPDSRLLYLTELDFSSGVSNIYQLDAYDNNAWNNRVQLPISYDYFFFGSLQLGPDNRVYVSLPGSSYVGAIKQPNRRCVPGNMNACEYTEQGVKLQDADGRGGECLSSLPNMIDARSETDYATDFSYTDSACFCVLFIPNKGCGGAVRWNFGDGDTSIHKSPRHCYSSKGNYVVTLITGGDTITKTIRIGIDTPVISGLAVNNCNLSPEYAYTILNRQDYTTYTWSVSGGSITRTEAPATAFVKWSTAGRLRVLAENTRTGCSEYSSYFNNNYLGESTISGASFTCYDEDPDTLKGLPTCVSDYYLIQYSWQWSSDGVNWTTISTRYGVGYIVPPAIDSITYFRRIRVYGSYSDTSNVVVVKKQMVPTVLDSFPSPVHVDGGQVKIVKPRLNGMGTLIKWQKWTEGILSKGWTNYAVSALDSVEFFDTDKCRKAKEKYRLIYHSYCPDVYDTAVMDVIYQYDSSDIWMKDADDDDGTEPYPGVYYISTDVWVRTDAMSTQVHQTPVYTNSSTYNHVYVKVRNRGTETSQPADLYLYWMHSAGGAIWPRSWKYNLTDNGIVNTCSGPFFGLTAPLGGEINSSPISVPSLAPGAEITLSADWIPPNPAQYCYMGNKKVKSIHVCLLARLEQCDDYPHGMTYPEKWNTYKNITNNNNIISRNTAVVAYDTATGGNDTVIWTGIRPVRNEQGLTTPIRVRLYSLDNSYYNDGYIHIILDDLLMTRWVEGGSDSKGVKYLGENTFLVEEPDEVFFNNISLDEDEVGFMGYSFRPYAPMIVASPVYYEFRMEQEQDDDAGSQVVGGVQYILDIPAGSAWNISGQLSLPGTELKDIRIYPNPAASEITIEADDIQRISLYDITGRLLLNRTVTDSGNVKINVSDLPPGMVMVKVYKTDGSCVSGKVTIAR